jgi:integrase
VQFLMLTALRRNEAAELRRSEVVAGVVRLPPERVKNRVAFTLPLSGLALDILDSCPKGGEYFFPAKRDQELSWVGRHRRASARVTGVRNAPTLQRRCSARCVQHGDETVSER